MFQIFPALRKAFGEYADIDELNHLAHLLSELNESELDIFSAAVSAGEHTASVGDLINLVHNIGCYDFYRGITDDETLGHIYVEDMEMLDVPEPILPYFDFEAYGRDARINENGRYINGGYMIRSGDSFEEIYHGKTDIPKRGPGVRLSACSDPGADGVLPGGRPALFSTAIQGAAEK